MEPAAATSPAKNKRKSAPEASAVPRDIIDEFRARTKERAKKAKAELTEEQERAYEAERLEMVARKKTHAETIAAWAAGAFKRWQLKLHKAGAELVAAGGDQELTFKDSAVPANKCWVLCIGPSAKSHSTHFSVGAGAVVYNVDPAKGEWDLADYSRQYSHTHPVAIYAEKPEQLWPGDSIDNYRDCALLMAAGVGFMMYHRSSAHPKRREDIAHWLRRWECGDTWDGYQHFESVYMLARNDRELIAGVVAVAERTLAHISKRAIARRAELDAEYERVKKELNTVGELAFSVPRLGAALL